jgi:hypothetical protein
MVLLRAKEATFYVCAPLATVGTTTTFATQLTGQIDYSGRVKSISISGAEADTETVYLFGSDANGRQNVEVEEQNMTDREFSGTMVYQDNKMAALANGGTTTIAATGYTRTQGDGVRYTRALFLKFVDSAGTILHAVMNNARFTSIGDISLDAEGHAEQEVKVKCSAKDYYEEFKA